MRKKAGSLFMSVCIIACSLPMNVEAKTQVGNESAKNIYMQYITETNKRNKKEEVKEQQSDKSYKNYSKVLNIMGVKDEKDIIDDNFAGTYENADGELVVLLDEDKKGNEVLETSIEEIDADIVVDEVKYNYQELENCKNEFDKIMEELVEKSNSGLLSEEEKVLLENIVGCGITIENNCNTVYMKTVNSAYIELFKKYFFDSDIVKFERNTQDATVSATKLKLGRAIYMPNGSRCSIGLKAYTLDENGKKIYGFVTCGHGWAKGNSVYLNSARTIKIGTVRKRQFSGKVDASFVEVTNSNYKPSRIVYYSNSSGSTSGGVTISTSYLWLWYTGFTVYKAGSTTYLTKGKVTDYSYSCDVTDASGNVVYMKDMYRAKILVQPGDSGGVLYKKDEGEYCAIGITESKSGDYANFVRWENIDDKFGIWYY